MEMIVDIINTHFRLLERDFHMFAGSTRKAHNSMTQNIFIENAINKARYNRYQKS